MPNPAASATDIYNEPPLDEFAPRFQPARLGPKRLREWCQKIITNMLGSSHSAPIPGPSIGWTPQRSDTRYPLPIPPKTETQTDMVYILQAADFPGSFNVQKADLLGVPRHKRGKFKQGENVEVDDGLFDRSPCPTRPKKIRGKMA